MCSGGVRTGSQPWLIAPTGVGRAWPQTWQATPQPRPVLLSVTAAGGVSDRRAGSARPAQANRYYGQGNRDHDSGSDAPGGRNGRHCQQQGNGRGGEGGGSHGWAATSTAPRWVLHQPTTGTPGQAIRCSGSPGPWAMGSPVAGWWIGSGSGRVKTGNAEGTGNAGGAADRGHRSPFICRGFFGTVVRAPRLIGPADRAMQPAGGPDRPHRARLPPPRGNARRGPHRPGFASLRGDGRPGPAAAAGW